MLKKALASVLSILTICTCTANINAMEAPHDESHKTIGRTLGTCRINITIVSYDENIAAQISKDKIRYFPAPNGKTYEVKFTNLIYNHDKWSDEAYVNEYVLNNKANLSKAQYVLFVYDMVGSFDTEKGDIDSLIHDLFYTPIVGSNAALWFKSIKSINRDCAYMMVGDYSLLDSKGVKLEDEEVKKLQDFNSELSIQLERQLIWGQLIPGKSFPQCRSFAVVPGEKNSIDDRIAEYLPELENRKKAQYFKIGAISTAGIVLVGGTCYGIYRLVKKSK